MRYVSLVNFNRSGCLRMSKAIFVYLDFIVKKFCYCNEKVSFAALVVKH